MPAVTPLVDRIEGVTNDPTSVDPKLLMTAYAIQQALASAVSIKEYTNDLNDLKTTGTVYIASANSTAGNHAPVNGSTAYVHVYGVVVLVGGNPQINVRQIWAQHKDVNDNTPATLGSLVYEREYIGTTGTWSAWVRSSVVIANDPNDTSITGGMSSAAIQTLVSSISGGFVYTDLSSDITGVAGRWYRAITNRTLTLPNPTGLNVGTKIVLEQVSGTSTVTYGTDPVYLHTVAANASLGSVYATFEVTKDATGTNVWYVYTGSPVAVYDGGGLFPDWANGVALTVGTTYTAAVDGMVSMRLTRTEDGLANAYLTINGVQVLIACPGAYYTDYPLPVCFIPIRKGDTYLRVNETNVTTAYYTFYPAR